MKAAKVVLGMRRHRAASCLQANRRMVVARRRFAGMQSEKTCRASCPILSFRYRPGGLVVWRFLWLCLLPSALKETKLAMLAAPFFVECRPTASIVVFSSASSRVGAMSRRIDPFVGYVVTTATRLD